MLILAGVVLIVMQLRRRGTLTGPESTVLSRCITADNIEVAQFVYPLPNNSKIRKCTDTITSKAVLIISEDSRLNASKCWM